MTPLAQLPCCQVCAKSLSDDPRKGQAKPPWYWGMAMFNYYWCNPSNTKLPHKVLGVKTCQEIVDAAWATRESEVRP